MNTIIENLRLNKDKIKGIVFGPNGYVIYLEQKSYDKQSKAGGMGDIDDEVRDYLDNNNIPAVDMSNGFTGDATGFSDVLPIVGTDMREGPICGLAKSSFEVYANLAALGGAEIYNVRKMDFIPEMFANLTERQVLILNNATDLNVTTIEHSGRRLWQPEDNGTSFAAYIEKILASTYDKMVEGRDKAKLRMKNLDPLSNEHFNKFSESISYGYAINRMKMITNTVTWNYLMVKAGNLSEAEAWDEAKHIVDAIQQDMTSQAEQNPKEQYKHLHTGLEQMKPVFTQFNKVANRFIDAQATDELQP